MDVVAPFPGPLRLVGLALPIVFVAGRAVARHVSRQRAVRRALAPGIALALWLLAVHVTGIVTHSFVGALGLGTSALAAGTLLVTRFARGRVEEPAPSSGPATSAWAWLAVALVTAPIARMAIGWSFHDEYLYTGHLSVASEIQNGFYPPRSMTFPDVQLRYHYGFDLLVACIGALLRIRVDDAIDVATIALWAYAAYLLWVLGDAWFGRGRGWTAMVAVLFAGGLPVCLPKRVFAIEHLLGVCEVKGLWTSPPVVSNFFQHPWGLGIPIALAALLVFSVDERARRGPRLAVLALLLATLSLSQIVLFVTFVPSLFACELARVVLREPERRLPGALGITAATAAAVVVAIALGGFLAPHGSTGFAHGFTVKPWVVEGRRDTVLWHVQSFGYALPLGALGVFFVPRRARLAIALLVAGSLGVLNLLHYAHSWDIVKFANVVLMALGLGVAALAARAVGPPKPIGLAPRSVGVFAAAVFVAYSVAGGAAFALFIPLFPKDAGRFFNRHGWILPDDDVRAASFLRTRVRVGELVFRREGPAVGYAQWAGLPVPWIDWAVYTFGFTKDRTGPREKLLKALPAAADEYRKQHILWFVLEPGDKRLNGIADRWIARAEAEELARFGSLRVVKLGSDERPNE